MLRVEFDQKIWTCSLALSEIVKFICGFPRHIMQKIVCTVFLILVKTWIKKKQLGAY